MKLFHSEPALFIINGVFFIMFLFFCTEVELPMAEDWSICIEVYGTQPSLAPYRYFDTYCCLYVTQKYTVMSSKRCWVGTIIPVYKSLLQYMPSCLYYTRHGWYLSWKSECVFVYPGSTLLTGSSSLQLWSTVDGVKDDAEEEIAIRDSHSAWKCIWQSK